MTLLLLALAPFLILAVAALGHDLHSDRRGFHPIPRSLDDEAESHTSVLRRLA